MWNIGRHIDKISRTGFSQELKMFAPSHSCPAADNIDNAFQIPMMMGASLRIGLDRDSTGPQLLRPGSSMRDGCHAIHSRRLRRVVVELSAPYHFHSVFTPIDGF